MRRHLVFASRFVFVSLLISICALACAPRQDEDPNAIAPSAPQPMPPSSSLIVGSDTPMPTTATASADSSPNDTTNVPLTIDIHNDCSDNVPIFLGEKPKFGSGTKTSVSANSTSTFPRGGDGTVTVWIIDDNENGLASVHVTKRMKKIEIGRSCRTLDAN